MTWGCIGISVLPAIGDAIYSRRGFLVAPDHCPQRGMYRRTGAEPLVRLLVDDPSQLRLAAEQLEEIDDVEGQQRARSRRDDGGVARRAGEQRQLAEERPVFEPQ